PSFYFSVAAAHRDLHAFPTRRSSDLSASGSSAHGRRSSRRRSTSSSRSPRIDGVGRSARRRLLVGVGQPALPLAARGRGDRMDRDRKSTRLNSSHLGISYAVFCLKKK